MKTLDSSTIQPTPPRRTAPFDAEPGFYEPAALWLYGNTRLLQSKLVCIPDTFGRNRHTDQRLNAIEGDCESAVLDGQTLVTGIHCLAHQRAAVVPLRWGAPRILVLHGGFFYHLGVNLNQEPFRTARLWRYEFDPNTDLVISRKAPNERSSPSPYLPSVDALIRQIVDKQVPGLLFE